MTAKTMAAILATHRLDVVMYIGTGQEHLCICGNRADSQDAHQSEELSAAGYGDVREAGAKALDAAADIAGRPENRWWAEGRNRAKWLRSLAAAVRGEG